MEQGVVILYSIPAAVDVRSIGGGFFVVPAIAALPWVKICSAIWARAVIAHRSPFLQNIRKVYSEALGQFIGRSGFTGSPSYNGANILSANPTAL